MATGAESEAQGNFTGTVSSARGKQAAQVGARGQQNYPRQQHQSCNKCFYSGSELIAQKTWTSQQKTHVAFVLGISLFQIRANRVQIGGCPPLSVRPP